MGKQKQYSSRDQPSTSILAWRRIDTESIVRRLPADGSHRIDAPNDAWVSDDGQAIVITRSPFFSDLFVLGAAWEVRLHWREPYSRVIWV
jgi:hypothetical protein